MLSQSRARGKGHKVGFIIGLQLLVLASCVHTDVIRTGRNTREITVSVDYAPSVNRVRRHLKHEARQLKCDRLEVLDLRRNYAIGICTNK